MASHVDELRTAMKDLGVDAYIVPSQDPHQNEYVPPCWQRRAYVSGFTGSAGDLVVTANRAGLFTDSRYFIQAEAELEGSGIALFRMGVPGTPKLYEWLREALGARGTVGIDPKLFSYGMVAKMRRSLGSDRVVCLEENPVDLIWHAKETFPLGPAEVWPLPYAGESAESKLARVRERMAASNADALVVTTLDAIAWLFNIRGRDVPFNPVLIGYALVHRDRAVLFIRPEKTTPALCAHLEGLAEIVGYDDFGRHLTALSAAKSRVVIDPDTASQWVADRLGGGVLVSKRSPIVDLKAVKNETELSGFKNAHVRDGVAMVRFLSWLDKAVPGGKVTEVSAADQLLAFRREGDLFQGESFSAISACGAHGAIVHYDPRGGDDALLVPEGLYLIDSGAQYLDGTTDITRTVALGAPTDEETDRFTRVLKGHIELALAAFPAGTSGPQLDTIARKPLWDAGLNYGHGTGHGVGAYLNVHEGPQAISYYRGAGVPLEKGMVLSNEPGFYKAGEFGIRIENLVCVVRDDARSTEETEFLRLENLTLCPIDRRLVDPSLLSSEALAYLNRYHETVRDTLSPLLEAPERRWL
jgi:Xaa-Pro aminopeptidase